ncbi:sensor histidine kinase [Deinococcus sp. PESE-13]
MPIFPPLKGGRGRGLQFWDLFPLLWLVWLVYPVQAFTGQPRPWPEQVLFWGTLAAFVAVYVFTFGKRDPDDRWAYVGWLAALLMWALGSWLYGPSALSFLVYGGSLIGWQRRQWVALGGAAINTLLMVGRLLTLPERSQGDFIFILFVLVSAYASHAAYRGLRARRRLAQVQLEKEKLAAGAERERIARDLHDLLGHTLSVIVLKSELAGKLAEKHPQRAAAEIREVERISREALSEVRAAVQGYRGSGLAAELARAKVALDTAGIRLVITDTLPELPTDLESTLAMVLREAVTNVVRHSGASELRLTLRGQANGFQLTLQDDGRGGDAPEGTGLNSMRERLRAMGGTFERDGQMGTRLQAFVPLSAGAAGLKVPEVLERTS